MQSPVIRDPEIMGGELTFRGTRVLVRTLFDYVQAGQTIEDFFEGFPTVPRESALQVLEDARQSVLAAN